MASALAPGGGGCDDDRRGRRAGHREVEAADPAAEGAPASTPEEIEAAARATADIDGNGELATTPVTEPTSNSDLAWLTEQVTYDLAMLDLFGAPHLDAILAGYREAHPLPEDWRDEDLDEGTEEVTG